MGIVRAIANDILQPGNRYAWVEAMVRNMPGETGMAVRSWLLRRYFARAGEGLVIYPGARIMGPGLLSVGHRCRIGINNFIQANGEIELGDDVILGPDVKIWSVNHVFQRMDVRIWDQGYEHKKVTIGSGVWIGAASFIMPGANIGDHVIISAGSVVSGKDVEPGAILAGNPARRIGTRTDRVPSPPAFASAPASADRSVR